jgi:hypothetical protein
MRKKEKRKKEDPVHGLWSKPKKSCFKIEGSGFQQVVGSFFRIYKGAGLRMFLKLPLKSRVGSLMWKLY